MGNAREAHDLTGITEAFIGASLRAELVQLRGESVLDERPGRDIDELLQDPVVVNAFVTGVDLERGLREPSANR